MLKFSPPPHTSRTSIPMRPSMRLIAMSAILMSTCAISTQAFSRPLNQDQKVKSSNYSSSGHSSRHDRARDRNRDSRNHRNHSHNNDRSRNRRSRHHRDRHSNRNSHNRHSNWNRPIPFSRPYYSRGYNSTIRDYPLRHYGYTNYVPRRVSSNYYSNRSYTPYRSAIGISFNFGNSYNPYRWAPSAYSFYSPSYGTYGGYTSRTTCRRVNMEGWHHGHRELVSVKLCSNPWDGEYIVQGSERVITCRW